MTIVIAQRDGNTIHMVSDRMIVNDRGYSSPEARKLVLYPNGLLTGWAGTCRVVCSMEAWLMSRPDFTLASDTDLHSMYSALVAMAPLNTGTDTIYLMAQSKWLVCLGSLDGWRRIEPDIDHYAIGSGREFAKGSWAERTDLPPKERLSRAVWIAARFMPGHCSTQCDYASVQVP